LQARLCENAQKQLQEQVTPNDQTPHPATADIVFGTSARSILEYAGEKDIDLIVMGTHGRGGLAHLLMGSVAEKVVRQAACPVLTVRQARAAQARIPEPLQREWVQTGS